GVRSSAPIPHLPSQGPSCPTVLTPPLFQITKTTITMTDLKTPLAQMPEAIPAEAKKTIPPISFKISGDWEKTNREASSWVTRATGIKLDDAPS
ncbi:MAG: hypothetical protein SNJ84_09740, partial [Verrucomicrobiia bacterium]